MTSAKYQNKNIRAKTPRKIVPQNGRADKTRHIDQACRMECVPVAYCSNQNPVVGINLLLFSVCIEIIPTKMEAVKTRNASQHVSVRTWKRLTACGSWQTDRASSRVTLSIMSFRAISPVCLSAAKFRNRAKHCSRDRQGPINRDLLTTSETSIQFSPNCDTAYTRARS